MLGTSICPKCQKSVSIPAEMDVAMWVRCPLCNEEYPISHAIPPTLIPVANAAEAHAAWAAEILVESTVAKNNGEKTDPALAPKQSPTALDLAPMAAIHRRRRPPKPWWQTLIEIVTGGLMGCLVTYYVLALWLGPELKKTGFPILSPLPGITWLTTPPEKTNHKVNKPEVAEPEKPLPNAANAP
jgi:hypothetical protein